MTVRPYSIFIIAKNQKGSKMPQQALQVNFQVTLGLMELEISIILATAFTSSDKTLSCVSKLEPFK